MVLWIRPRNKAAIKPVEVTCLSSSQKSPPSEVKHQHNAHLFLRLQRCFARGVRSPGSNFSPEIVLGGFEKIKGLYPKEKGRSLARRRLVHHDNALAHTFLTVFDQKRHDTNCPPPPPPTLTGPGPL